MALTQKDLQDIGNLMDQKLEKNTEKILKQMKKETKTIVKFFDKEYLGHDRRIKRIETHLDLSPLND